MPLLNAPVWSPDSMPQTESVTRGPTFSADDRRISKVLIQERDERTKALDDVRKAIIKEGEDRAEALQDLWEVVKRQELALKHQGEAIKTLQEEPSREAKLQFPSDAFSAELAPLPRGGTDPQTRARVDELQAALAKQASRIEGHEKILEQYATDLQHVFAFASSAAAASGGLGDDFFGRGKEIVSTPPPVREASPRERSPTSAGLEAKLQASLRAVSDMQSAQTDELVSLRSLLVEMYMALQLHSVKAGRIALRCTELSKEDKRLALERLDAKERRVQEDVKRYIVKMETLSFHAADTSIGLGATPDSDRLLSEEIRSRLTHVITI